MKRLLSNFPKIYLVLFGLIITAVAPFVSHAQITSKQSSKGWSHLQASEVGSNFVPISAPTSSDQLALQNSVSLPTQDSPNLLSEDVDGDGTIEVVTVQGQRLYVIAPDGTTELNEDISVSGATKARVTMLDDVSGDGVADIAVSYQFDPGSYTARFYKADGTLLKEFQLSNDGDGAMRPVAVVDEDVIVSYSTGFSLSPRGLSRWDYQNASKMWDYVVGPIFNGLSLADADDDGIDEMTYGTFSPHNGASGNGLDDGNTYSLILDAGATAELKQKYPAGNPDGSLLDRFARLEGDSHKLLSFKTYNDSYPGTSRAHVRSLDGSIEHTFEGLPEGNWEFGWADVTGNDAREIVASNRNSNQSNLYVFDTSLNVVDSISLGQDQVFEALADTDGDEETEVIVRGPKNVWTYSPSLEPDWSWTYEGSGTLRNLIASDNDGDGRIDLSVMTEESVLLLEGGSPPTADFGVEPRLPQIGETVTFDASGSSDPDGQVQSYEWDFDDDGTVEATGQTANTSFSSAGDVPVTLTVKDDDGSTDDTTQTVTVNAPPTASNDTTQTPQGVSVTTEALANDTDPDGRLDSSSVQIESSPSSGIISQVDTSTGAITYAPDAGFTGTDTYSYTVADTTGARSEAATVTVEVQDRGEPFITTWETTSPDSSITIPTDTSASNYDFVIDWGDGTTETYSGVDPDPTHSYDQAGTYTVDSFSGSISETDLFCGRSPDQSAFRRYRRWAFESAALDLALKQAGTDLATRLDRTYDPVRFVVSTRLDDPPTGDRIDAWLRRDPELEFKLDPTPAWTEALVERLAATDAVRTVDLKGYYEGTDVDQSADPELYELVVEGFPGALIEDPELTDETRPLFDGHKERVAWDYPIDGVESVESLPWDPEWLNIKPSRFGSIRSLFETIEYCREHGIDCYGGGQFELDVGRTHLHALASLFYPEGPNDVAPRGYNAPTHSDGLPSSPLSPPDDPSGMMWKADTDGDE